MEYSLWFFINTWLTLHFGSIYRLPNKLTYENCSRLILFLLVYVGAIFTVTKFLHFHKYTWLYLYLFFKYIHRYAERNLILAGALDTTLKFGCLFPSSVKHLYIVKNEKKKSYLHTTNPNLRKLVSLINLYF